MAGCGACGRQRNVTHQVRKPDGTIKTYGTEVEAKAAAASTGGSYERIQR